MTNIVELIGKIIQKAIDTLSELATVKAQVVSLQQELADALANDKADADAIAEAQAVAIQAKLDLETASAVLSATQVQLVQAQAVVAQVPELESAVKQVATIFGIE